MGQASRLLWLGDLAATGFGTVTTDVGRELVRLGADVRFVSQNDVRSLTEPFLSRTLSKPFFVTGEGGIEDVESFLPNLMKGEERSCAQCESGRPLAEVLGVWVHTFDDQDPLPCDMLRLANGMPWGDWKPDACFLLGDFYGMREMVNKAGLDTFRIVPTYHYVPIEGHDLPPAWAKLWQHIKPIAMTNFGAQEIARIMGETPPMVYHGVDGEVFHPVSPSNPIILNPEENGGQRLVLNSKAACKFALFGRADVTVALRVDRFMPRKGYDALIRAMAPVMRERPNLVLGMHCRARDFGGYLPDTISKYPDIADRILNPQFGPVPRSVLVAMYNAADLYVSTSAEGFGLTIAEAIACGVPAVGLDYSAVPEVIGPAGKVVPVGRYLDNEYAHHWALPDEEAFGKAVAYLVDHPQRRMELGRWGPPHVAKSFRWDTAAERFMEIAGLSAGKEPADSEPSVRELVAA